MSRIGNLPITIPAGVEVKLNGNIVTVKGAKGELNGSFAQEVKVAVDGNTITLSRESDMPSTRAKHGLTRALINNMIVGVSAGYVKELEVVGVGFRANANGQLLELALGYSHPIVIELPKEVKVSTETLKGQAPSIKLESIDKQLIGQVAAKIRSLRKPEPYKGKGVRYKNEQLRKKAGKSASKK
jgi:large subunit ribosomal protein L6